MKSLRSLPAFALLVAPALVLGAVWAFALWRGPAPSRVPAAAASAPMAAPRAGRPAFAQTAEKDAATARTVLARLARTYQLLDGVTVTVGVTPDGKEAVAYYADGQIVVSKKHTVGIERILDHEVWHVIDWRDNGRLDWGENLPPRDAAKYLKR